MRRGTAGGNDPHRKILGQRQQVEARRGLPIVGARRERGDAVKGQNEA
jgi:hypothetical protein